MIENIPSQLKIKDNCSFQTALFSYGFRNLLNAFRTDTHRASPGRGLRLQAQGRGAGQGQIHPEHCSQIRQGLNELIYT